MTRHHTVTIDGLKIFYHEAGRLLALCGTWDATAGEPLVNGLPWQSAEAVRRAAGGRA